MGRYIEQLDVEDELSPAVVRRVLDDRQTGFADARAIARAIANAENLFDGRIRGIYALPLNVPLDPLVATICLILVKAILAKRFPHIVKMSWEELKEDAQEQFKMLREHDMELAHPLAQGAAIPDCLSHEQRGFGLINRGGPTFMDGLLDDGNDEGDGDGL